MSAGKILVVDDDPQIRRVMKATLVGNSYEVREGIKPGDKVIVSGTQFLMDGVPVIPMS